MTVMSSWHTDWTGKIVVVVQRFLHLDFRLQHRRRTRTWLALQHRPSQETPSLLGYQLLLLLLML